MPRRFRMVCLAILLARPAAAEEEPRYSPWQSKQSSWFVSSASDVGFIYARPHLTLGWGAPFWQFVGVDAYAISTNSFAAAYVGLRANLPFLDVQWGGRKVVPFDRRFLAPAERYRAEDLSLAAGGERSVYQLIEFELTPVAPLLHGVVFAELHPLWIDAPRDQYLFEEMLRAVVKPPFAMRTRLGYLYAFDEAGNFKLGAMTEYIVTPGRPKNVTRVGPVVLVGLSRHVELLTTATLPVSSPDELGLYEGSYGFIGARLRWAKRLFTESSPAQPSLQSVGSPRVAGTEAPR
jgi:hypothetical protein